MLTSFSMISKLEVQAVYTKELHPQSLKQFQLYCSPPLVINFKKNKFDLRHVRFHSFRQTNVRKRKQLRTIDCMDMFDCAQLNHIKVIVNLIRLRDMTNR